MYEEQAKAIDEVLAASRDQDGKPVGLTLTELKVHTGMLSNILSKVLNAGPTFVRENRDTERYWFRLEDCPYPVASLTKDAILIRVGAACAQTKFCDALRKYMGERCPATNGTEKLFALASEADCRKAYGMIGPLPDPAAINEERASVRAAMRGGKAKDDDRPEAPRDPWPFKISRLDAQTQLEAGAERRADYVIEYEWTSHNLDNLAATPELAPSNRAWSYLVDAAMTRMGRSAFLKRLDEVMKRKQKEDGDKRKRDDDHRTQMNRFDVCFREFQKMDREAVASA